MWKTPSNLATGLIVRWLLVSLLLSDVNSYIRVVTKEAATRDRRQLGRLALLHASSPVSRRRGSRSSVSKCKNKINREFQTKSWILNFYFDPFFPLDETRLEKATQLQVPFDFIRNFYLRSVCDVIMVALR